MKAEAKCFNRLFPSLLFCKTSSRISVTYQLLWTLWHTVSWSFRFIFKWGKKEKYIAQSNKDIEIYLNNTIGPEDIEYSYKGVKELNYKIKKGDKLGVVTAKYNNKVLTSYDVFLDEKIDYYHPILYTVIIISLLGFLK